MTQSGSISVDITTQSPRLGLVSLRFNLILSGCCVRLGFTYSSTEIAPGYEEWKLPSEWFADGILPLSFAILQEDPTLKNVIERRLMPLLIALFHSASGGVSLGESSGAVLEQNRTRG